MLAKNTKKRVFKFNSNMFVSWKYLGNFAVQYIIWLKGNTKLNKKMSKQKNIGYKDFFLLIQSLVFFENLC